MGDPEVKLAVHLRLGRRSVGHAGVLRLLRGAALGLGRVRPLHMPRHRQRLRDAVSARRAVQRAAGRHLPLVLRDLLPRPAAVK